MAGKHRSGGQSSGLSERQKEKQPDRGNSAPSKAPKPSKKDPKKPSKTDNNDSPDKPCPKPSPEGKTRYVTIPERNKDAIPKLPQDPKNHCLGCAKTIRAAAAETIPGMELEMCFRQSPDHNCELCRKKNSSCEDVPDDFKLPYMILFEKFSAWNRSDNRTQEAFNPICDEAHDLISAINARHKKEEKLRAKAKALPDPRLDVIVQRLKEIVEILDMSRVIVAQLPVADVAAAAPSTQTVRHGLPKDTKTPGKRLFQTPSKGAAQKTLPPAPKEKIIVPPSAKKPAASSSKPSSVTASGHGDPKVEKRSLPARAAKEKIKDFVVLSSESEYEEEVVEEESSGTASSDAAEGREDLGEDSADEEDAMADMEGTDGELSGDFVDDNNLMDTDNARDDEEGEQALEEGMVEEPPRKKIRVEIKQPARSASAPKSGQKSARKPTTPLPSVIYGRNLGPGHTEKRRLAAIAQMQAEMEQRQDAQSPLTGKKRARPMTEQEKFDEETV